MKGQCFCGGVRWLSHSPILWAAICHCADCRRAASSDHVSWFGVHKRTVQWFGSRKLYQSSSKVVRSFCEQCGSPLSFETQIFPDETHLYAVTLENPQLYTPTAHIFWSERLPWILDTDSLPKHEKGLQDAAKQGKILL